MSEKKADIKTSKATVTLLNPNLVRIVIDENAEIGANEIYESNKAKYELVGDAFHCVLFVTPKYGSISAEGREASASQEVNKNAIAKAVIVSNLGQRLFASFFIRFNNPPVPTKIFSNQAEGLDWLKEITEEFFK